ncbi:MAG: YIP1 family protein [Anaerolineae bacterium]|nr:YIP1 family protein [Anaerolineae bacterium]
MSALVKRVWNALFLREEPYVEMRDVSRPAIKGIGIIALVAVVVALLGLVGTTLEWATSPSLADVQRVVLDGLQRMDWYHQMGSEAEEMFAQNWEMAWQYLPILFGAPNVGTAAARVLLLPLGLILMWLLYGILAHLSARILGGEGSLGQTLGCTALAVAPQLFNLVAFIPHVAIGGIVSTWVLLCRYVAVKSGHRLTTGRALVATLLPYVVLGLLSVGFGIIASVVVGSVMAGRVQ